MSKPEESYHSFSSFSPFFPFSSNHLNALLLNCGHVLCRDHSYNWNGLRRGKQELMIWQYTISGMGRLRFGKNEYEVPPGYGFLLLVPEDHCYYLPEESESWEFIYIGAFGADMIRLAGEFRRKYGFLCHFEGDSKTVAMLWRILDENQIRIPSCYEACAQAYRFIMAMFDDMSKEPESSGNNLLTLVSDYCQEHAADPITVADLAHATHYSRWHFTRRFQEVTGKTPHRFIIEFKMNMAMRKLQCTTATVKEIAAECGCSDISYFCKQFQRIHHTTPAKFRNVSLQMEVVERKCNPKINR